MRRASIVELFAYILLLCLPVAAKKHEQDYTQPYLLLEVPVHRLKKELNRAGSHGYRVLDVAPAPVIAGKKPGLGKEIIVAALSGQSADTRHLAWGAAVLMEKAHDTSPVQTWQYRVNTACNAAGIRRAMNKAAGYHLLPSAAIRVHRTFVSLGDDCILLMERPSEAAKTYEYEVLSQRSSKGNLNHAVAEAGEQGFETVFEMPPEHQGRSTIVEEKIAPTPSRAQQTTGPNVEKVSHLERTWVSSRTMTDAVQKLNALGLKGYHVLDTEPPRKDEGWRFLVERIPEQAKSYKYKFATAKETSELGHELDVASHDGYRLVRTQMTSFRLFQGKKKFSPVTVLLQKQQPGKRQFEYAVIGAASARTEFLLQAIARARAQKYQVVEFWRKGDEYIVVAERQADDASK